MPAILQPTAFTTWLDGSLDEATELIRPYAGAMVRQEETPPDNLIEIDA